MIFFSHCILIIIENCTYAILKRYNFYVIYGNDVRRLITYLQSLKLFICSECELYIFWNWIKIPINDKITITYFIKISKYSIKFCTYYIVKISNIIWNCNLKFIMEPTCSDKFTDVRNEVNLNSNYNCEKE